MKWIAPLFALLLLTSCAIGTTPAPDTAAVAAQANLQADQAKAPSEAMQPCPQELPLLKSGTPAEVKDNHRQAAKLYHECADAHNKLIQYEQARER